MDRLENLAFFIRVIEKGGVASAGRDFGMSASTASDRLSAIEQHYGTKLLNRTTRAIHLTEEGKLLLEKGRHLVAEASDLEAQIKLGTERLSGFIRISAPQDMGQRRIVPLLDAFMEMHPDINIELHLSDEPIDLIGKGIDIGIRLGSLKDSSLMIKKLGDNRRVLCAAPGYIETHGAPQTPDELQNHNCLIMQFGSLTDREWTFNIKGRRKACAVSGNRITNNGGQVYRWCLEGKGIALKSIWDVKDDLEDGRLVEMLPDYAIETASQLQLVYPGGGKPNRRIRALIDYLASKI